RCAVIARAPHVRGSHSGYLESRGNPQDAVGCVRSKGVLMPSESARTDGVEGTGVRVTRQRRRVPGVGKGRKRAIAAGALAVVLAGAGVTYASTDIFGQNKVGTEYPNGLQVSADQLIQPLGERVVTNLGKFMGSTVSPDGHFLAATSTDKSIAVQI